MREELYFEWDVYAGGYRWVESKAFGSDKARKHLTSGHPIGVPGYEFKRYAPLERHTGLFRTFAEVGPNEAGIKAFADKFGLLGDPADEVIGLPNHVTEKGQLGGIGETLEKWATAILTMRQLIELWDMVQRDDVVALARHIRWHDNGVDYLSHPGLAPAQRRRRPSVVVEAVIAAKKINPDLLERFQHGELMRPALYYLQKEVNQRMEGHISPRLLWAHDHSALSLCLVPVGLLGALWLQFAQAIERNSDFRKCVECGTWFQLSPGSARSDKIYCSNTCRTKAFRQRKAKAVELSVGGTPVEDIARELSTDPKTVQGWIDASGRAGRKRVKQTPG